MAFRELRRQAAHGLFHLGTQRGVTIERIGQVQLFRCGNHWSLILPVPVHLSDGHEDKDECGREATGEAPTITSTPHRRSPRPHPDPTTHRAFGSGAVSYTHLRAHETDSYLVCR